MNKNKNLPHKAHGHLSLYVAIITLVLLLVVLLDSTPYEQQELTHRMGETVLAGSLNLPTNIEKPRALMIFVHGDGPMGRDAFGYYNPMWTQLAEQGIASYSWDKAGVGDSTGNWLNQTMQDRADEILSAIAMLRQHNHLRDIPIGLIGFSQAGWVMPKALNDSSEINFAVFVSTPINWLKQSEFLTQVRLQEEDLSEQAKQRQKYNEQAISELLIAGKPHSTYLDFLQQSAPEHADDAMSKARYHFVQQNILVDSHGELAALKKPIFVAFGSHDNHVNVPYNVRRYEQIFSSKSQQLELKIYPDANHALLKNSEFGHLSPSIWWVIKMSILGADGFTKGFLDDVTNWLNIQLRHQPSLKIGKQGSSMNGTTEAFSEGKVSRVRGYSDFVT